MDDQLNRALTILKSLRDDARMTSDRLCAVWEAAAQEGEWVEADALSSYKVAEARWQGLTDAVHAVETMHA